MIEKNANLIMLILALVGATAGAVVWANTSFGSKDAVKEHGKRLRALENGQTEIRVNLQFLMESEGLEYKKVIDHDDD